MELSVVERMVLITAMNAYGSKVGNITTLLIQRDLMDDIGFNEEELALLNFKNEDEGLTTWDNNDKVVKTIKVGPKGMEIIKSILTTMNKEDKLTYDYLSLWQKMFGELPEVSDEPVEKEESDGKKDS